MRVIPNEVGHDNYIGRVLQTFIHQIQVLLVGAPTRYSRVDHFPFLFFAL